MRRLAILIVLSAFPLNSELLPIRTYTTADGLASDRINGIVADSRGFLWFCTPEGLSRFDGSHFVSYGVDEGLPHPMVSALIETRSGDHWIGTPRGLSRIAASGGGPRFTTYKLGRRPRQTTLAPFWRRGPADSGPRPRPGSSNGPTRSVFAAATFRRPLRFALQTSPRTRPAIFGSAPRQAFSSWERAAWCRALP